MLVLIMRHGEADAGTSGERHLTESGVNESRKSLQLIRDLGYSVNAIACSPLERAKETAQVASEVFRVSYTISDSLEPESIPERVYEELDSLQPRRNVLLISHQPLVSKVLTNLLGAEFKFLFPTSTIAVLSVDKEPGTGSGTLISLISPFISNWQPKAQALL